MRPRPRCVSFCSILLVLAVSCSKTPETPPDPVATIENLKVAHACAFKRSLWYANAAVESEREGLGNLAALLRAISRSEGVHAANHERLLTSKNAATDTSKAACLPLGTTRQALKMAQSLERTQVEGLYPAMVGTAVKESWPEAAEQFRQAGLVDAQHMALMKQAADRSGTMPMRVYRVCTVCGHIATEADSTCAVCSSASFETL